MLLFLKFLLVKPGFSTHRCGLNWASQFQQGPQSVFSRLIAMPSVCLHDHIRPQNSSLFSGFCLLGFALWPVCFRVTKPACHVPNTCRCNKRKIGEYSASSSCLGNSLKIYLLESSLDFIFVKIFDSLFCVC